MSLTFEVVENQQHIHTIMMLMQITSIRDLNRV